jgi:hypothetical protein
MLNYQRVHVDLRVQLLDHLVGIFFCIFFLPHLQVIVSGIAPPTPSPISVTPRRIDDSELLRNIRKG